MVRLKSWCSEKFRHNDLPKASRFRRGLIGTPGNIVKSKVFIDKLDLTVFFLKEI